MQAKFICHKDFSDRVPKNIFCKEIGIDGSLVPIRSAGTFELGTNSLAYLPHSGEIIYNEEIISKL